MNDKTYQESFAELGEALRNLYYTVLTHVGSDFISFGERLIKAVEDTGMSDDSGPVYDACEALENLSNHKLKISVRAYDEFSHELRRVVGEMAFYNDDGQLVFEDGERVLGDE